MSEKANTESFAAHEQPRPYRRYVELTVLGALIALICGLLTLPTVFYHLPLDEESSESSSIGPGSLPSSDTCSGEVYNGSICKRELQSLQNCNPDRCGSTQVYVISNTSESEVEQHVARLMGGLQLLKPSPECGAVIGSFLCSFYFGLCGDDGKAYRPSSGQCETIATDTCSSEFERALTLIGKEGLPQCETLSTMTTFEFGCTGECFDDPEEKTATPHITDPSVSPTDNDVPVTPESTCSAEIYTGEVCKSALQSIQNCLPGRCGSSDVYIPYTGLQDQIEQQLTNLVGGLQLVNPSPDCQAAILPFLCSYYFGLCDSSDHLHAPSLQDCVLIANQTCAREFQIAVSVLGRENLPKCETLSIGATLQLDCDGQCNETSTEMAVTEPSDNSNDECSAEVYVGTVCRASLHSLQSCIPDRCNTTEIYIPSTGLQDQIEQQLSTLVGGLQLVNPSPDCQAAILPFLCSYYFGLCDSSDHLHAPALQDCVLIANQTCAREFQIAVSLLGRENLPKCETLSIGATLQLECDGQCNETSTEMAVTEPSDNSNDECSAEVYVGTVCRASLHSLQSCIPDRCNTTEVYIPSTGNQSELEQQLTALLGGLQRLEPGPECQAAVVPFLCSYYFRLCDSDGRVHQPSSAECATIASETCAAEFQRAIQILGSGNLPRCDVLPPIGIDCQSGEKCDAEVSTSTPTLDSGPPVASSDDPRVSQSVGENVPPRACRLGFYLETSNDSSVGVCTAECGKWEEFPHHVVVTGNAIVIVQAVVYIIAAVVLLLLSCIHRKRMYKFPAIFVIYEMFPLGLFEVFILIGFMNQTGLFCSSKSLPESLSNPTAFCHIQGGVSHFVFLQQILMWLFHIIAVFWTIQFPMHAKSFETKGYTRYVHYGMLALTFILPLITIIIIAGTGGCRPSRVPAIICLAQETDVTFYAFVLPLSIVAAVGMSLVVVMFWILYHITRDLSDIRKKKHEQKREKGTLKRRLTSLKEHATINAAEMKILIIFVYFSIFIASTLITFTLRLHGFDHLVSGIGNHFSCEAGGIQEEECHRSFERVESEVSSIITYALIGLFPIVSLIYVINFQELKQKFSRLFKRTGHREILSNSGSFRPRGTSTSTSTGV